MCSDDSGWEVARWIRLEGWVGGRDAVLLQREGQATE